MNNGLPYGRAVLYSVNIPITQPKPYREVEPMVYWESDKRQKARSESLKLAGRFEDLWLAALKVHKYELEPKIVICDGYNSVTRTDYAVATVTCKIAKTPRETDTRITTYRKMLQGTTEEKMRLLGDYRRRSAITGRDVALMIGNRELDSNKVIHSHDPLAVTSAQDDLFADYDKGDDREDIAAITEPDGTLLIPGSSQIYAPLTEFKPEPMEGEFDHYRDRRGSVELSRGQQTARKTVIVPPEMRKRVKGASDVRAHVRAMLKVRGIIVGGRQNPTEYEFISFEIITDDRRL